MLARKFIPQIVHNHKLFVEEILKCGSLRTPSLQQIEIVIRVTMASVRMLFCQRKIPLCYKKEAMTLIAVRTSIFWSTSS